MLILIGGASRAGKTLLAQKLLRNYQVPYFSVDYLVSGFRNFPELGISHDDNTVHCAERLWPILKPILKNIVEAEPLYLVEGDRILPNQVAEFTKEHDNAISCFLGYTQISTEQKVKDIQSFSGEVNNWLADESDEYIFSIVKEGVEFSKMIQAECTSFGLKYFDVSDNFLGAFDSAYFYIKEVLQGISSR